MCRINSWKLQGDLVNRSATTSNPGHGMVPGYGEISRITGEPVLKTSNGGTVGIWADQGNGKNGKRPAATAWGSFENENERLT